LHDSALEEFPDRLEAQDDWARLSNNLLGYAYLAMEFEQVDADSSNSSDQLSIDPAGVDFLLLINGEEW
jgi:hypothetical protein